MTKKGFHKGESPHEVSEQNQRCNRMLPATILNENLLTSSSKDAIEKNDIRKFGRISIKLLKRR